jgi:hypothetical protein
LVRDQALALEVAGGDGYAYTPDAEHVRQKLVCDPKSVFLRPILAHQEPLGQSWSDHVVTLAGRSGRQLRHEDIQVAMKALAQSPAAFHLEIEVALSDPQCNALPLYQGTKWSFGHSENQLRPEHAFRPDHPDFDAGLVVDDAQEGDEAFRREVDVFCALSGLAEHGTQCKLYRFADIQEPAPVLRGQASD